MMLKVDLKTNVQTADKGTFVITLSKDWHYSIDNKQVKSYWKYKVSKNNIILLNSVDNEHLIDGIK